MAAESESPAAGSPAAELPTAELPAAESPAAESGSKLPPALSCCFLQTHRKQSGVHMTGDDIAAALARYVVSLLLVINEKNLTV